LAKRSYILIDKEGVVRFINTRPTNTEKDLLSTETLLDEVKKINKK
jgi:alkyl hydroperoxide reductase subunit AhpC